MIGIIIRLTFLAFCLILGILLAFKKKHDKDQETIARLNTVIDQQDQECKRLDSENKRLVAEQQEIIETADKRLIAGTLAVLGTQCSYEARKEIDDKFSIRVGKVEPQQLV